MTPPLPPLPPPDTLRVELLAPDMARVDDAVPLTIRIVNTTDRPLELHLQGRDIVFELVVTDAGGVAVWRRLAGATVQGILRLEVLAPGDTLELADMWRPVAPGRYTVQGFVPTDAPSPLAAPPAAIRVVAR